MTDATTPIDTPGVLAVLGFLAVLASVPLSWLRSDEAIIEVDGSLETAMRGIESGDGELLLVAVIVLGIIMAIGRWRAGRWGWLAVVPAVLAGLLTAGISLMYIIDPATGAVGDPAILEQIGAGIGLYIALLGGILLLFAGVWGAVTGRSED